MIPILQQLYYKHMCRNNKENKETARSWGKGRENFSLHEMKVVQLCLTLCDPMEYTVHGILQARILEWVAFLFSRVSSQPRDRTQVSHIAGRPFTSWATLVCMAAINPNHSSRAKLPNIATVLLMLPTMCSHHSYTSGMLLTLITKVNIILFHSLLYILQLMKMSACILFWVFHLNRNLKALHLRDDLFSLS